MATSQEDILIKININNKESVKSVKEIDKSVDNLNGTLNDLDKTVDSSFGDMGDTINETTDSQKELAKATEKVGDSGKKANKGMKILSKGLKGVGTAFKAMGIGALIGLLVSLWEAMKKNQKIMDAIDTVMQAVSIVFNKVTEAIVGAYEKVSDATGGFDAMKIVVINLFKIALVPLKLVFYAIKASILALQLGWEKSFLGGGDEGKIKSLTEDLKGVKDEIIKLKDDTIESAKLIKDNVVEAINEVATLTKTIVADVTESIKTITVSALVEQANMLVQSKKALLELEIQQQGLNLQYLQAAELQRQLRDDTSLSLEERLAANEELGRILEEQMAQESAILDEKIRIATAELAIDKDNHEKKLALMQLEVVERAELNERITGQRSEQLVNQVGLEKEAADATLAQIEENNKVITSIYRATAVEKLEIDKEAKIVELELTTLSEEEKNLAKLEIEENYQSDLKDIQDKATEEELEADKKLTEEKIQNLKAVLAVAQQASGLMQAINDLRFQAQTNAMDKAYQAEVDAAGGNTEEIERINEEYGKKKADLEYKQAKSRKAQSIIDATISTMVAVATALPNVPLSILAGVMGGLQIGLIAATPVPKPQYEFGGVIAGTTTHAQGGVDINAEGGEGMINNVSMANPDLRNLASAANEGGGGVGFGDGNGIKLDAGTIAAIGNVINSKKIILNTNELSDKNDEVELIDNESYL